MRGFRPKTFIYTCPEILKSVREQVGRILFTHKIPFAFVFMQDGKMIMRRNYNCIGKRPVVILAGVLSTIEILKNEQKIEQGYELDSKDIVLFYDENTIGLDVYPSPMLYYLCEFLKYLPSQTIFSSATHPDIESIVGLERYINLKYSNSVMRTINYSKVLIGTQLHTLKGELYIPHNNCEEISELERFIVMIEKNLIYKKFYT